MKNWYFLFLITVFWACDRFGNQNETKDQATRIVCLAKQYNEIIYALDAQKDLVAVDLSSTYPPAIKKLPTVGYHRALSAEGILQQKPTLILHDDNIGPEPVIRQLEQLKIPMKVFTPGNTLDSVKILMREMGAYFDKNKEAEALCAQLDQDMQTAANQAKQYKDTVSVLVIHFGRAMNQYFTMTKKSIAAQMIGWAGGKIAVDDVRGMRQLSAEVVAAADPDVILLTDFGYDRLGSPEKITELPGIAATKAAKNKRIYRIEEHDLVYLGPRTGKNTLLIQKLIHEGAAQ